MHYLMNTKGQYPLPRLFKAKIRHIKVSVKENEVPTEKKL